MYLRWLTTATLVLRLVVTPAIADDDAKPAHDFARWHSAIAAFEAEDNERRREPGGVLFIGSSTIRLWDTDKHFPDLDVINRGFGGSEMIDTLHFADRIVIPYQPRVMLLYAGSNDIARDEPPCAIARRFEQLIAKVQQESPQTQIVFLSVKPTTKRWNLIHRIRATNALVEVICIETAGVHYLDAHTAMLNDEGEPETKWLSEDGLHLNAIGYEHLTEVTRPVIDRLLADDGRH